jgi:hypothetical protein
MKDPIIWCIVPFSRPQNFDWVKDHFDKQTYHKKKLVIVENGKAVGTCKKHGFSPDLLLKSKTHQSYAKNEGLIELESRGYSGDVWTTWDDDDYYGPHYLEELAANAHKAEVIGKANSFMRMTDGELYLLGKWAQNDYVNLIHGPTVTGRVGQSLLFEVIEWGEDLLWTRRMRELGAKVWATSRYNWCYFRYANTKHTWLISDEELKISNSGNLYNYGPFDKDIVDNIKKPSSEPQVITYKDFDMSKTMTFKEIRNDTGDMVQSMLWGAARKLEKIPGWEHLASSEDKYNV